jgi:putative redox protein
MGEEISPMVHMSVAYQGQKQCELTHAPSGSKIETDAPRDNNGKGERFSPTDLMGAALASCVLTTMAIVAERDGISIEGATAEVVKEMANDPRRIKALPVQVRMPAYLTAEQRAKLERVAHHCPVHKSLHPDISATIEFEYV